MTTSRKKDNGNGHILMRGGGATRAHTSLHLAYLLYDHPRSYVRVEGWMKFSDE